jgi:hypothetical protein
MAGQSCQLIGSTPPASVPARFPQVRLSAPASILHSAMQVPAVDSPLLPLLQLTAQMTWFDVTDGGRLIHAFLDRHPEVAAALVPPQEISLLLEPAPASEVEEEEAEQAAPAAAPVTLLPGSPLTAFLAAAGLLPATAPAALTEPAVPAGSSSSGGSDDTCGMPMGLDSSGGAAGSAASAVAADAAASGAPNPGIRSLDSGRQPPAVKGLQLPARKAATATARPKPSRQAAAL